MTTSALRLRSQAITNHVNLAHSIKINFKIVYSLFLVLSVCMLVFYIFTINTLTEDAYLIKNYNKQLQVLSAQNNDLQTNVAQASFLGIALEKAKELNFEKTTNIQYVHILQNSLAEAK